ncbi:MAG: methylated-DNA--[Solobacterium sp.]|nr:methylated-DNA--[protein]-cysteine S-methyltransferase [Solobacterium sp.]
MKCVRKFYPFELEICEEDGFITEISFVSGKEETEPGTDLLKEAVKQLEGYFRKERTDFDLPLAPAGSEFERKVWHALQKIPYGKACSYQDIAEAVGNPKACRAVGGANHRNPIVIVIPCHRVIAKNRTLGGYGGGLDKKRLLLELEGVRITDKGKCL